MSGPGSTPRNAMALADIPVGLAVHNIELIPGRGAKMVRSAGGSAQLLAREGKIATLALPSGEIRQVNSQCRATIGIVGNEDHSLIKLGKAGRKRWLGRRPKVRGTAKNPVAHPTVVVREEQRMDIAHVQPRDVSPRVERRVAGQGQQQHMHMEEEITMVDHWQGPCVDPVDRRFRKY